MLPQPSFAEADKSAVFSTLWKYKELREVLWAKRERVSSRQFLEAPCERLSFLAREEADVCEKRQSDESLSRDMLTRRSRTKRTPCCGCVSSSHSLWPMLIQPF